MNQTVCRLLNVLFIAAMLFYYQNITMIRAEEAKIYDIQVQAAEDLAREYERQVAEANEEAANQSYLQSIIYGNGSFSGSGQGFGGLVEVEVVVEDYTITEVRVVSAEKEDPAYYNQAVNVIPKAIIEAQSSDVDTVSGATFSSYGIIDAAEEAIEAAEAARPTDEVLLAERKKNEKD